MRKEISGVGILKPARNLCVAVTLIAAGCLLLVGLAEWSHSGIGVGGLFGGRTKSGILVLVSHLIGAMGVIWLGWFALNLAAAIMSIAEQLPPDNDRHSEATHNVAQTVMAGAFCLGSVIDKLTAAVRGRLSDYSDRAAALQAQIEHLQIQIQLSKRQKRNIEAIIYSIRDAVVVADESGRLLMANEAAGRLFGFDYQDSCHKPIAELVGQSKREFADLLSRAAQGKARVKRRQIEFLEAEMPKSFDCIISRVYDGQEQVCGVVAVLHDVTREKEISQMKNDFVSHVSHELKTPLASITAYAEMLCEGEAQDEQTRREFYSVIHDQAGRLNRLIEDILNVSRIESGLIKVEKKPVSLTMLMEEQLRMIKGCAEEKNVEVISQKPIVFDRVAVDRDMMSQVIVNLLSNAIKYTPSGGAVRIESEVDELARVARVRVTDTGVGIPEDEIERVFDKFYRVQANKNQARGTGLGLNLVKQIVEKVHSGRVFVTSKPGVGSTFGFELPLATAEALETV
jgi:two-component system phosphate regulon sensor histidine kinase PhoR